MKFKKKERMSFLREGKKKMSVKKQKQNNKINSKDGIFETKKKIRNKISHVTGLLPRMGKTSIHVE